MIELFLAMLSMHYSVPINFDQSENEAALLTPFSITFV